MKIYTRTGDRGETGLFGSGRVPKDHPRVEAYGAVDELNALVGLARATGPLERIDAVLLPIQRDLFGLGALLATPKPEKVREQLEKARIGSERIAELEATIDASEADLAPLTAFILPGGTPKAATLHVARTVCRRAERRAIALAHTGVDLPDDVIIYLNRLSDLLFVLARLAARLEGVEEITW
jgi:cob(I)alamin adenosyltransferase